jgi:isochorismate pyruvate lyase
MLDRSPHSDSSALSDLSAGTVAAIDQQILLLLSSRFALARSAGDGVWDDEDERRAALAAIRRRAFELGVPVSLVADFWDRLTDASAAMHKQAKSR